MLVSWRRTETTSLLRALGAKPESLLPGGVWPESVFDWVLVLQYDARGRLVNAVRVVQELGVLAS